MATAAEKSNYRYSDFYCFMSFADFNKYISQDDDGNGSFPISSSERRAERVGGEASSL